MMRKTHIAAIVFLILAIMPFVKNKITFCVFALIASIFPDIDSEYSTMGRFKILRIFQFFTKHRGMIHSLTFCVLASFLPALFFPVLAFPVFLGYSVHLMLDSLTIDGIMPFWPVRKKAEGIIRTNSGVEKAIFLSFLCVDIILFSTKILLL